MPLPIFFLVVRLYLNFPFCSTDQSVICLASRCWILRIFCCFLLFINGFRNFTNYICFNCQMLLHVFYHGTIWRVLLLWNIRTLNIIRLLCLWDDSVWRYKSEFDHFHIYSQKYVNNSSRWYQYLLKSICNNIACRTFHSQKTKSVFHNFLPSLQQKIWKWKDLFHLLFIS